MNNFLKSYWAIILLVIFIVITLFPPFNWYLSNTISKSDTNKYEKKIGKYLPLKSYEFIFSQPVKWNNFVMLEKETHYEGYKSYEWDVKKYVTTPLKRSLIFHELMLNYILSSLIIFLLYLLGEKFKLNKNLK